MGIYALPDRGEHVECGAAWELNVPDADTVWGPIGAAFKGAIGCVELFGGEGREGTVGGVGV